MSGPLVDRDGKKRTKPLEPLDRFGSGGPVLENNLTEN